MSDDGLQERRRRIRAIAETGHVRATAYRDHNGGLHVYFQEHLPDGDFELFACVVTSTPGGDNDPEVVHVTDATVLNDGSLAEILALWLRRDGLFATVEVHVYGSP